MTKLEKLIEELCPNGVEYKTLGEIASDIYRGAGITRNQVTEDGTPCVRYGEIYTTYGIYFDKCVSHTDENLIQSKKYFEYGDILFAITGESVEDIAKSTAYVGNEKCLAGGDIVVLKHNQNPKYLSYVLSTTTARIQKSKGKVKSKVVHSSVPAIKEIRIPLPPLEVQAEIVRILDDYSTSVAALQQELEKELTARKKQYEYYRDKLLSFGVLGGGTSDFKWRTLGEMCSIKGRIGFRGYTRNDMVEKGEGAISFSPANINNQTLCFGNDTYISWKKYDESPEIMVNIGDILLCKTGSTLGKTAIVDFLPEKATINPQLVVLKNIQCNNRYLKYILTTFSFQNQLQKRKGLGSVPNISQKEIGAISIPILPLPEQERIVEILDRFDKLCNDLSDGLPAEIEARRKQYEYYRDKLLTFPMSNGQ